MDLFTVIDEVQAIARTGLHFAENPYDRERYERLLAIALEQYEEHVALPDAEARARFAREVGAITPKVGADAAIFDERGRILLVRRQDDGLWGLVAGWVEAGEDPATTAVREAKEEVGLDVVIDRLAGVAFRSAGAAAGPHSTVSVVYVCTPVGGEITPQPHEVIEARYCDPATVTDWHLNHEALARLAVRAREEGATIR
jgi:ADP-ribose pyrophosphatase YjhB (NUDIX family)